MMKHLACLGVALLLGCLRHHRQCAGTRARHAAGLQPSRLALTRWCRRRTGGALSARTELSSLVAAALDANPDLAIAAERVRQAEAQVALRARHFSGLGLWRRHFAPRNARGWRQLADQRCEQRHAQRELRGGSVGKKRLRRAFGRGCAARQPLRPGDRQAHARRGRCQRLFPGSVAARPPGDRARKLGHSRACVRGRGLARAQRRRFGARPGAAAGGSA